VEVITMNETPNSRPDELAGSSTATQHDSARRTAQQGMVKDAKEAIRGAAGEVSDLAKDAARSARDRAEELAERGKTAGADQMAGFARAIRGAAEDLEEQSPEVATYVRQAADGLEQAASSVRGRSIGEFVDMVDDLARRQPAAFFGSTVLAGFVLSRFVKSRADRSSQPSSGQDDAANSAPGAPPPHPMSSTSFRGVPS
jgi:hypothetical protein